MALNTGARLGPYEIGVVIGAGGMGEVYRATDTNLKRAVAIKRLFELPALSGSFGQGFEVSVDGSRFLAMKDAPRPAAAGPTGIVVVLNWDQELKRLVPTN